MSQPWPPPPDLASIRELISTADIESFIAQGSPADEYDAEADLLFTEIKDLPTAELTADRIVPTLRDIWRDDFGLMPHELDSRHEALHRLAAEIARFFGPEAQPSVRQSPIPD